jgi:hypothetical protein
VGFIAFAVVLGVIAVGLAVYQLVKSKKAVTVASVEATVKADAAAVQSDVKKS